MSITTKFNVQFDDKGLKQAEKQSKQTAEKIQQDINKAKEKNLKDLDKGVKSFGESLSGIGGITNIVSSKFAAMGVAIGLAIKTVKDLWDQFTESASEFQMKKQFQLQQSKTAVEQTKNTQNTDNGYFTRLQQLASAEDRSNATKQEAIRLIEILTKRYGDLGIQINGITGEITGLDQAQQKMLAKQNVELYKKLSAEQQNLQGLQNSKTKLVFARANENNFWTRGVSDFLYQNFGLARGNVQDAMNQINSRPLEEQLKILQALRDKSTRESDIQDFQSLIDLKKQEIKLQEQLNNLEKIGATDEKTAMERMKVQNQKNKVISNSKEARTERQKQTDIQGQIDSMKESAEYAKITDDQQKLVYLKKKLAQEQEKENNLVKEQRDIGNTVYGDERERMQDKARMLELEQKIKEAQKNGTSESDIKSMQKELQSLQTKNYKTDVTRSDDKLAYQKLETDRLNLLKQQEKIKIEIAKIEEKSNKYYADTARDLQNEIDYQTLILQGKFEEAEQLKIINQLKKQGLKIDQQKIDDNKAKQQKLSSIQLQQQFQKQAQNLIDKYTPKTKNNRIEQRIRDLQESNKRRLTDDEKKKVKQLVTAEIDLENLEKIYKPDLSKMEIKTNSLTQRGGFAGGAVVSNVDRINVEIKNYASKQTNLLTEIKNEVKSISQNGGII